MSTDEHGLSQQEKELVAIGASVGAGCHPCVDYHLSAAKKAELADYRVLAAIMTAQQVAAQAAQELARHVQRHLDAEDPGPAVAAALDTELAAFGAAIGANDRANIERHLNAAAALGASPFQLRQALEVAHTVQTNAAAIHLRAAQHVLDEVAQAQTPATGGPPGKEDGCGCDEAPAPAATDRDQRTALLTDAGPTEPAKR